MVSLTQATELGTVYTPDELKAVWARPQSLGLRLHMDGARFANAVASLGCAPKEITWQAGVDVLCFGRHEERDGRREAVVFFDRELAARVRLPLQAGRAARLEDALPGRALGRDAEGRRLAAGTPRHANAMAALLHSLVKDLPGVKRALPARRRTASSSSFPAAAREGLRERGWRFYDFIGWGGARLMCSWDTSPEDVRAFAADLAELTAPAR